MATIEIGVGAYGLGCQWMATIETDVGAWAWGMQLCLDHGPGLGPCYMGREAVWQVQQGEDATLRQSGSRPDQERLGESVS